MFHVPCSKLHDKGFTLVEMMIALAVLVIMTVAIVTLFIFLYREQATDIVRIQRISAASQAIKKMSSEIRKINRGEVDGSSPIEFGGGNGLMFYSDIDDDGLMEKVEYSLSGTNLEKIVTEPELIGSSYKYVNPNDPIVIVSDVKNGAEPIFRYYGNDYTGSEDPLPLIDPPLDPPSVSIAEIRLIEISLDINPDNNYLTQPFHIETKIHPRNLKDF